jgi:hypothetical protein
MVEGSCHHYKRVKQKDGQNLLPLPSGMSSSSAFALLVEESAGAELDASGWLKIQSVAFSILSP